MNGTYPQGLLGAGSRILLRGELMQSTKPRPPYGARLLSPLKAVGDEKQSLGAKNLAFNPSSATCIMFLSYSRLHASFFTLRPNSITVKKKK